MLRANNFVAIALAIVATPIHAQTKPPLYTVPLSDQELARITGKFLLPNGVELALSVTNDTVINGQLVLRTVLTVDHGSQVLVFGRSSVSTDAPTYTAPSGQAAGFIPTGVNITFDRQSGVQTLAPVYSVGETNRPSVTVGAATQAAAPPGLLALPLTPGGVPVTTADGSVVMQTVHNGTQVTLTGNQFAVSDLLGQSIATAVVNSANNRTLDSVTNVAIDLRNVTPLQLGSAQMRIDSIAADVSRRLIR